MDNKAYTQRIKFLINKELDDYTSFGKKIGVCRQTVGKWVAGTVTPDLETFLKIADTFNVSVDWLLGRTDIDTSTAIPDARMLCKYAGLSEKAINKLHDCYFDNDNLGLDALICSSHSGAFTSSLNSYFYHVSDITTSQSYDDLESYAESVTHQPLTQPIYPKTFDAIMGRLTITRTMLKCSKFEVVEALEKILMDIAPYDQAEQKLNSIEKSFWEFFKKQEEQDHGNS